VETGNRAIEFEDNGTHCVVVLGASVDGESIQVAPQALEMMQRIQQATHPRLILDLSKIDYCGSAYVAFMVRIWKAVQQRDGAMALCGASHTVRQILEITRLTQIWDIYPTRADAMRALGLDRVVSDRQRWCRYALACLGAIGAGSLVVAVAWGIASQVHLMQAALALAGLIFLMFAAAVWFAPDRWAWPAQCSIGVAIVLSFVALGFAIGRHVNFGEVSWTSKLLLGLALVAFYALGALAWYCLGRLSKSGEAPAPS
jgi:anti-anti-sigma factor